MKNEDVKIIFMGTPEFAVPSLQALIAEKYGVAAVFTNPDKPVGRKKILTPPPVKIAAQNAGIPVFQPASVRTPEIIADIKKIAPDLIIICAYGKIIPKEILELPRLGVINVHASLLPRWRGASPIQFSLLAGDKETGITIMAVNEKMDEGGVYSQKTVAVEEKETAETLSKKLSELGAKLLIKTLPKIISGGLKPKPQEEFVKLWGGPSYCKILKREDGRIDWNKSAEEIERQVRAFSGWPESFFVWKRGGSEFKIKLTETAPIPCPLGGNAAKLAAGETFLIEKKRIGVKTGGGHRFQRDPASGGDCLEILKLQPEGKNPQDAKSFLNGYPDFIGAILK